MLRYLLHTVALLCLTGCLGMLPAVQATNSAEAEALQSLEQKAQGGDAWSSYQLAWQLLWDQETPSLHHQKKGVHYLQLCHDQAPSYHYCTYGLSYVYQHGEGVAPNEQKAFTLAQEAMAQGNHEAAWQVAYQHSIGELTPKDYYQATKWYMVSIMLHELNGERIPESLEDSYHHALAKVANYEGFFAFIDSLAYFLTHLPQTGEHLNG